MSDTRWGSQQKGSHQKPVRKIVRDEMLDARIATRRLARQSQRVQKVGRTGGLKKQS